MTVRFGLIGAGRMGKVFANTLAFGVSEVDLVAVAEPGEQALAEVKEQFLIPDGYSDYHQLLERQDIEAVVIATPTNTHADVVRAAAAAGKHIFCEKPLSQNLDECDKAIEDVKRAGVQLADGFYASFRSRLSPGKRENSRGRDWHPRHV